MAELAESIEFAFSRGDLPPQFMPHLFFERALELHAPDISVERAQMKEKHGAVEGFNQWAKKYKLRRLLPKGLKS